MHTYHTYRINFCKSGYLFVGEIYTRYTVRLIPCAYGIKKSKLKSCLSVIHVFNTDAYCLTVESVYLTTSVNIYNYFYRICLVFIYHTSVYICQFFLPFFRSPLSWLNTLPMLMPSEHCVCWMQLELVNLQTKSNSTKHPPAKCSGKSRKSPRKRPHLSTPDLLMVSYSYNQSYCRFLI